MEARSASDSFLLKVLCWAGAKQSVSFGDSKLLWKMRFKYPRKHNLTMRKARVMYVYDCARLSWSTQAGSLIQRNTFAHDVGVLDMLFVSKHLLKKGIPCIWKLKDLFKFSRLKVDVRSFLAMKWHWQQLFVIFLFDWFCFSTRILLIIHLDDPLIPCFYERKFLKLPMYWTYSHHTSHHHAYISPLKGNLSRTFCQIFVWRKSRRIAARSHGPLSFSLAIRSKHNGDYQNDPFLSSILLLHPISSFQETSSCACPPLG